MNGLLHRRGAGHRLAARSRIAALLVAAFVVATASPSAAAELQRDEKSGLQYLELATGGASGKDPLPLVVAIHGLGDNPQSFRLLLDDLPVRARLVVPRAPTPHGADGFSWFAFHADDEEGMAELGQGIRAAAGRVATLIESLAKKTAAPSRAVVCGFSQGGMLAFALAAEHPELVSEAIPVSGTLPVTLWPKERPTVRPLPKVFALHGEADRLIPVSTAKWAVEALRGNGYSSSLKTWPGVAHALSHDMRAALISEVVAAVEALSPQTATEPGGDAPSAQSAQQAASPLEPAAVPSAPAAAAAP